MNTNFKKGKGFLVFIIMILVGMIFYISILNNNKLTEREPFIGIGYNLEYKDKIFLDMTDLEIAEAIDKITDAAKIKAKKGKRFKITEEELEKLDIKGLDPQYLNMIKISTE